jgi:hypothetical protein
MSGRAIKVARAGPREAAKLVYQWVKTGAITFREFEALYPLIEMHGVCEDCGGERGVPGNENIVDGRVLCDYCHADHLRYKQ